MGRRSRSPASQIPPSVVPDATLTALREMQEDNLQLWKEMQDDTMQLPSHSVHPLLLKLQPAVSTSHLQDSITLQTVANPLPGYLFRLLPPHQCSLREFYPLLSQRMVGKMCLDLGHSLLHRHWHSQTPTHIHSHL